MNERSNINSVLGLLLLSSSDEVINPANERRGYSHDIILVGDHSLVVFPHQSEIPESSYDVPIVASSLEGVDVIDVVEMEYGHSDLVFYEGGVFGEEDIELCQEVITFAGHKMPCITVQDDLRINLSASSLGHDALLGTIDPLEIKQDTYPPPQSLRGKGPKHQCQSRPRVRRTGVRRK